MSLKHQVIKGIRWTVGGSVMTTGIQFLQNVILARILVPEDFGLMAMVLVFMGFILPVFDLGLSAAIIQQKEINSLQLSSLYWINILLGLLCFLIAWLGAPLADFFFDRNDLSPIIRQVSMVFLITPWGTQYAALLAKNLRFDLQNKVTVISVSLSFVLAIALAIRGAGVFALVYSYIFNKILETGMYIVSGLRYHKPIFHLDFKSVKTFLRFGLFQSGTTVINFLNTNIDKILIGKILGPYALGLYTIAWNLVLIPLRKINPIVNKIAFPVFSKLQHEITRVDNYYTNSVLLLMLINFPILLFLTLNAEEFLGLIYGDQWLAASATLSILAVVGLLKSFANPGGSLILSKGRSDVGFYWNIIWTILLTLSLFICLLFQESIEIIALGQLIVGILFGPIWHWLIVKFGKVSYKTLLIEFFTLLLFSIPAYLIVKTVDHFEFNNLMISFFTKFFVGSILYILYLFVLFKKRLPLMLKIIR